MKLRRPPSVMLEESRMALPMRSFIDVVFLLLIFFMVTTNFAREESRLPAAAGAEGGAATSDLQPQIVTVSRRGEQVMFVIGEHATSSRARLLEILRTLPKEGGVAIRAADDAPVWAVAAALQSAVDAGFEKRSYVPIESES